MNKATLLGISTQPKYDDNGKWIGADITASIEVKVPKVNKTNILRLGLKTEITTTLGEAVRYFGFGEELEEYVMKRVRGCLDSMANQFDGTDKDADRIYDIIRLKMPRFVSKSVERVYYSQNFETGEIFEGYGFFNS